jgi:phosphohistidine phosphatase SixA
MELRECPRLVRSAALLLSLVAMWASGPAPAAATEAAWARVANGGYTILLRHGRTNAPNDPPSAEIGDCATQNNLSDRGRQQASRIGARFAARATPISRVYTSEFCRTIETADLAFRSAPVEELPGLNPLDDDIEDEIAVLRDLVDSFAGPGNQVVITHPENIRALLGNEPREGEAVILTSSGDEGGDPVIVGRILLD